MVKLVFLDVRYNMNVEAEDFIYFLKYIQLFQYLYELFSSVELVCLVPLFMLTGFTMSFFIGFNPTVVGNSKLMPNARDIQYTVYCIP